MPPGSPGTEAGQHGLLRWLHRLAPADGSPGWRRYAASQSRSASAAKAVAGSSEPSHRSQ